MKIFWQIKKKWQVILKITAKTWITLRRLPLVLPTSGPIPRVFGCGMTSHFGDSKIPIGQHELQWILSAEQQDVCETQMPLSTQSPNYRTIFKISHDPGQYFRAGAFVKKYIYKKWVLMGLYYINCLQYGNYRQIYWHENSILKN